MAKELNTRLNQSILDIAIQETGGVETVFEIAMSNGVGITDLIAPGTKLKIDEEPANAVVLAFYKNNNILPATAKLKVIEEIVPEVDLTGVFDVIVVSNSAAYTFGTLGASSVIWTATWNSGSTTAVGDNPVFDLASSVGDVNITANVVLSNLIFTNNEGVNHVNSIDASLDVNFTNAFRNSSLETIDNVITTNCLNFTYAWAYLNMTTFPIIDTSAGIKFNFAWAVSDFNTFPFLDLSNATRVDYAWTNNFNLHTFPLLDLGACTNFTGAWRHTDLNTQSVENVLQALVNNGRSGLNTIIGTDVQPLTANAQTLLNTLTNNRGWTITFN